MLALYPPGAMLRALNLGIQQPSRGVNEKQHIQESQHKPKPSLPSSSQREPDAPAQRGDLESQREGEYRAVLPRIRQRHLGKDYGDQRGQEARANDQPKQGDRSSNLHDINNICSRQSSPRSGPSTGSGESLEFGR